MIPSDGMGNEMKSRAIQIFYRKTLGVFFPHFFPNNLLVTRFTSNSFSLVFLFKIVGRFIDFPYKEWISVERDSFPCTYHCIFACSSIPALQLSVNIIRFVVVSQHNYLFIKYKWIYLYKTWSFLIYIQCNRLKTIKNCIIEVLFDRILFDRSWLSKHVKLENRLASNVS